MTQTLREQVARIIEGWAFPDKPNPLFADQWIALWDDNIYAIRDAYDRADQIDAIYRAHLTSDEAVERAMRTRARAMWERPIAYRTSFGDTISATRAAITAALGEG